MIQFQQYIESCFHIASSRYRYDVEYSTMFSQFLQVRGTSASGKSTLAMLLGRHIRVQEPDVRVIWIGGWNIDDVAQCGGWSSYLAKRKGGSQARTRCLFLIQHRRHTRTGNSGTICSEAYTTTVIVAPLPLPLMAVHLRSST